MKLDLIFNVSIWGDMNQLSAKTDLLVAVGVWVSFADTKAMLLETSKVAELVGEMAGSSERNMIGMAIDSWKDKFENNFADAEQGMIGHIKHISNPSNLKEELIGLAQKILIVDEKLTVQEEAAIEKINSWFS